MSDDTEEDTIEEFDFSDGTFDDDDPDDALTEDDDPDDPAEGHDLIAGNEQFLFGTNIPADE